MQTEDYISEIPYTQSRSKFTRLEESEISQLFDVDELCRKLFEHKHGLEGGGWDTAQKILVNAQSAERAEWLFATRMLASYGSSVPHVRYLLDATPSELWLEEITQQRQELINQLAGTVAGKRWMTHMRKKNGWHFVARFLYDEQSKVKSADIDALLSSIDQIGILTALINGSGKKFGFDFHPVTEKSVEAFRQFCRDTSKASLILERLHSLIDGMDTPKRSVRPIRAAMDARIIYRPTFEWFNAEFGENCKIDKSSYNDYTNESKSPYDDTLYDNIKNEFMNIT